MVGSSCCPGRSHHASPPVFNRVRFLLALLTFAPAALCRAGHYEADTTSGLGTAFNPANGHASVTYGKGSASGGGGASNGGVSVSGTLTTVFHWVRDYPADDPPQNVVAVESCDVLAQSKWYGFNAGTPTAVATNGLSAQFSTNSSGNTALSSPPGKGAGASSSGTQPTIKSGGETITVDTCAPNVSASTGNGPATISISYSVSVNPVVINVEGAKPIGTGLKSLIGIHQIATMSASGCSLRDFDWSVSGPQIFGSVTMASDQSTRHYDTALVYPHAQTNSTGYDEGDKAAFYASKDGNEMASCTADAYAIDASGNTVDLGSVSAIKKVAILAPASTLKVVMTAGSASTFLPNNINPTDLSSSSSSSTTSDPALEVRYSVQAEPDFADYAPQVNLCQLASEDDTFTPAGRFGWIGWWLDTAFPYFVDQPADGTLYKNANDTPSQPVTSTWTAISIREGRLLSTIYLPLGGQYVPLKSLEWLWSATSSHGSNSWTTPTGGIGPTGTTYPDFDLDAVQWGRKSENGQSYPYPHP